MSQHKETKAKLTLFISDSQLYPVDLMIFKQTNHILSPVNFYTPSDVVCSDL